MGGTDSPLAVTDAGPIIHLDELGCLDLLSDFERLLVPRQAWNEVARHRPHVTSSMFPSGCIVDVPEVPSARLRTIIDLFGLDAGETAALVLMEIRRAGLLLCDDAAARLAAESLGLAVHGTLGILIRSIRRTLRSRQQVLEILRRLPETSTLHISRILLATVISKVEQAPG